MLIHGFSLVNARLLKAFGTAFYAIIYIKVIMAKELIQLHEFLKTFLLKQGK